MVRSRALLAHASDERGFTIVETMVALGVIFSVVLGLLGTMNAGVSGIVLSRQRNGATAVADEVLEQARGRGYDEVGHDLDDDTTLATDPAVSGTAPNFTYNGEPLAASSINSANNAPFTPHKWTTTEDSTLYTIYVYVTQITPVVGGGDPYRRLTVKVSWGATQFKASSVANSLVQSTYLYNATKPPNPWLDGVIDADAGSLTVTGSISGADLSTARLWLPYSHGEVHSRDIQLAKGYAGTARSQILVNSGSVTGCSLSNNSMTADCVAQTAVSLTDNDEGTSPTEYDSKTATDTGHTVSLGSPLSLVFGASNNALSQSAARAQTNSSCSGILGNDVLPFHCSDATGPASISAPFSAGPVAGSLLASSATARAFGTLDRTDVPSASRLTTSAMTATPAMDMVTITGGPSGYSGAVRIGASSVTASANSGQGAANPSVTGSAVTVQLWDTTLATPGYRSVTVTPGVASSNTATAAFTVGGANVAMTSTVTTVAKTTSYTTDAAGSITHAESSIASWLNVTIALNISSGGNTHANLVIELDYGRLTTAADYQQN